MVRIGTRGSKLALWQANHVKDLLEAGGIQSELVLYKTTGDRVQDRPLHEIGERGLFTKALDEALMTGEVDLAVHSSKDLPSTPPEGLALSAVLHREDPRDVLLAIDPEVDLDNFTREFTVGTSSLRRQALLRHYAPHFKPSSIRGNVDTRVAKLQSGEFDAIVLAYAGVKRMGLTHLIRRKLNATTFTPAVAQGAVGVVTRAGDPLVPQLRAVLNDEPAEVAVTAERAFLRRLEGGCHTPVFALATAIGNTLSIEGGVAALDGSRLIRERLDGHTADAEALGYQLADTVLSLGAKQLLHVE